MKREFGACTFSLVSEIRPDSDTEGNIRRFMPQDQYDNRKNLPLHAYGNGPFCGFRIPSDLHKEGVYVLTVDKGVVYVGERIDLSLRYNAGYGQIAPRNCYKGGQRTNCRINNSLQPQWNLKR